MVNVSWHDAQAFCEWSSTRLPTSAEWEHAARGPQEWEYPWGDEWDSRKCANSVGDSEMFNTAPVASYPPNLYGLYDMAGNVWEWCEDAYDSEFSKRVVRGGSWLSGVSAVFFRASYRDGLNPASCFSSLGFRCAK